MRWSWVLLATSPRGSAGAKEHPEQSIAAALSRAASTSHGAALSTPEGRPASLGAGHHPRFTGRPHTMGHESNLRGGAIERVDIERVGPKRAEGAYDAPEA